MRNLKDRKLNNKGFSFLLVIVAMSFVAILVAIMLLVSYQNFQMKHTTLKSEDNFYTAEQVLDEIKAGLQSDISSSVSEAYTYVLERYSETDGQDVTRNWYFQTKYVDTLRGKLLGNAANNTYSLSKLQSYVKVTESNNGTVLLEMLEDSSNLETNYNTGVTLKGLKLTYTDPKGYVSIISTDLRLSIPVIDFTQSSSSPDLLKYCIIADDGIVVTGSSAQSFEGNVYAGDHGLQLGKNTTDTPDLSINSERMIAKDGITINKNTDMTFVGNALWTDSINVYNSASLNASGNIFVKDDLSLEGAESSATLSGRYYGFSNPLMVKSSNAYKHMSANTAASALSSAIIINGKNSTLDLSGLNSIFIAGNSYINAQLGFEGENPLSIQMGESISAKGNQLAYLAPENAIVVTGATNVESGNPIVGLPSSDKVQVSLNVNVRLNELGGRRLSDLGFDSDDCQVYYAQGIAYVYMKFEDDVQAANYFNAYYKSDINKYKELFAKEFSMSQNPAATVTLNGSVFEDAENTIDDPATLSSATMEANGYQDMFFAFSKKLVPTYTSLSADEAKDTSTVFTNLIDVQALRNYLSDKGNKFVFTTPGEETAYEAILVDGPYNITTADTKTRLIVATGNVTLNADFDFKGLVICGGDFTISGGATVTAVPEEVSAAFQCVWYKLDGVSTVAPEEKSPMSFFKEGQKFMLDGIASGVVTGTAGSLIDLSDIIIYENWNKQ